MVFMLTIRKPKIFHLFHPMLLCLARTLWSSGKVVYQFQDLSSCCWGFILEDKSGRKCISFIFAHHRKQESGGAKPQLKKSQHLKYVICGGLVKKASLSIPSSSPPSGPRALCGGSLLDSNRHFKSMLETLAGLFTRLVKCTPARHSKSNSFLIWGSGM